MFGWLKKKIKIDNPDLKILNKYSVTKVKNYYSGVSSVMMSLVDFDRYVSYRNVDSVFMIDEGNLIFIFTFIKDVMYYAEEPKYIFKVN